ncbi:MAG: DNA repair protein RecN [Bacteroidetes bacterium 4484_249]|nr:MAG: DNA repair protein RecN [Bacteroidetes bacterium 4484_249]
MLSSLSIQNYALIKQLEIAFHNGFSVITGETGAGKSILLGALNLILGKRADTQVLMNKSEKCIVEGAFNIHQYKLKDFFEKYDLDYENKSFLRREINKSGKSRAFINDTPVNLNVLKELGEKLINIHSQGQTITLNDANFQLAVIDSYSGITESVNEYRIEYQNYLKLSDKLAEWIENEKQSKTEQDYFNFLFQELDDTKLRIDEQNDLERELEVLNHSEEIKTKLFSASRALGNDENSLLDRLTAIRNNISEVSKFSFKLEELSNRIDSSYIELSDILSEIEKMEESISFEQDRAEEITDRLDTIYRLQNKHSVNTIDDLLSVKEDLELKLNNISSLQAKIEVLNAEVKTAENEITKNANTISKKRQHVLINIEKEIKNTLSLLGIPDADFRINHQILKEPGKDGIDQVKFMFNANRGGELQELSKVASGGETSRLMLAIKSLISQKNLLPTVIFDEIDMGVSGAVADKVGNILLNLSTAMQVIAISHLPQIAGKGDSHYLVYKETSGNGTKTEIKQLASEERIIEIAKMLSGQDVTSASVETAKHLLKMN